MIDVMAFGAHPDDIEFGCGGILAKMAADGKKIVMVDLTRGELGTNGSPEQRKKEAQVAAECIGAERVALDLGDGKLVDSYDNRLELVRVVREFKPQLLLTMTMEATQSHPDHAACGMLTRIACRYARYQGILPNIPIHHPQGVLHYPHRNTTKIDFLIDVTSHIKVWKKMITAHASQMDTNPYLEWILKKAATLGSQMGVEYAQGLIAVSPLVIEDPMALARGADEI